MHGRRYFVLGRGPVRLSDHVSIYCGVRALDRLAVLQITQDASQSSENVPRNSSCIACITALQFWLVSLLLLPPCVLHPVNMQVRCLRVCLLTAFSGPTQRI